MTGEFDPLGALELTRKLKREPNISTALHIMQWELGDLSKCYTRSVWHPHLAVPYRAEAKKALGDLLFQAEVVANLLGTTSSDLLSMGMITVEDRAKEIEDRVGRFRNYLFNNEDPFKGEKKDDSQYR